MKFYHGALEFEVPEGVYYPREDSLLLAKTLEKENLANKRILEIGCGSGFLSIVMARMGAEVIACDVADEAVKTTKENALANGIKIACTKSDIFSEINGIFDLIVFNPPYLPDESNDKTYSGGKTGREVIEKFVKQAKKHLEKDGKILLLISSLTGEKDVLSIFHAYSFKTKIIERKKVPWEELMVIEARAH